MAYIKILKSNNQEEEIISVSANPIILKDDEKEKYEIIDIKGAWRGDRKSEVKYLRKKNKLKRILENDEIDCI